MWMGPSARFASIVEAAISYIQSEAATGDRDIISYFAAILEYRLSCEAEELRPIADRLASICGYILAHHHRFDLTPEVNMYGGLRPRFQARCTRRFPGQT